MNILDTPSLPHASQDNEKEDSLPETHFILSPFAFLFEGRDYTAMYHSISQSIVYGDEKLKRFFQFSRNQGAMLPGRFSELLGSNKWEELERLRHEGFIVPASEDPFVPLRRIQGQKLYKEPHIGLLYLLITNECNLRCRYCNLESIARKPQGFRYSHMPVAMAEKGIDLFLKLLKDDTKRPSVIFYGGEPLLNVSTLIESSRYIRERQKKLKDCDVDISAVLNSTLVTEEIARQFRELGISASISLDGLKHHHDIIRKYRNNKGSWEDSLRGYFILRKYLGRCGISCTIGPHNYKDIEEIAEFFASTLECRGLGFNILKGLPPENELEIPAETVTLKLLSAFELFRRYGIYEDRVMRKVRSFVRQTTYFYECGGYGGQIALCADGSLGPCHIAADDRRFLWGSIEERGIYRKILKSDLTSQWLHRSPLFFPVCHSCEALAFCGGGCAEEAYAKKGDINAIDENFCIHAKTILGWIINDLATKLITSGGLEFE